MRSREEQTGDTNRLVRLNHSGKQEKAESTQGYRDPLPSAYVLMECGMTEEGQRVLTKGATMKTRRWRWRLSGWNIMCLGRWAHFGVHTHETPRLIWQHPECLKPSFTIYNRRHMEPPRRQESRLDSSQSRETSNVCGGRGGRCIVGKHRLATAISSSCLSHRFPPARLYVPACALSLESVQNRMHPDEKKNTFKKKK